MPEEQLARLRSIRRGNRGVVTKLCNEADDILKQQDVDHERLYVIVKQLEGKSNTLKGLDKKILELCELEIVSDEIKESENFYGKLLECRTKIERSSQNNASQSTSSGKGKGSLNEANASQSTSSDNGEPQVYAGGKGSEAATKPKLQKIELPKFRGDVTRWLSFWDSFNSAIHTNGNVSDIDKFNYLKGLLEGSAAQSIQGLSLTSANYHEAISILKERYGNKQMIISAHMGEILKIPACVNDKASSLRTLFDKINVHTRGLASLGVSASEYGSLLIPIIMSKVPSEVRVHVSRRTTSEVWNIEDLMEVLKSEIQAREASESIKTATE